MINLPVPAALHLASGFVGHFYLDNRQKSGTQSDIEVMLSLGNVLEVRISRKQCSSPNCHQVSPKCSISKCV